MENEEELLNINRWVDVEQSGRQHIRQEMPSSRRSFLQCSLAGVTVLAPASLLAACGGTQRGTQTTLGNNVDSTATVAATASANGATPTVGATPIAQLSDAAKAFNEIMQNENRHVTYLKDAVAKTGAVVRPKPTFKGLQQTSLDNFVKLSQALENVGVGAYLMLIPAMASKANLEAVASIMAVEGQHAGFVNGLLGMPLSPDGAFEKALPQSEVVRSVMPYIQNLNGGANPASKLGNEGDILNFALLLEYLQAELYNANVPALFQS